MVINSEPGKILIEVVPRLETNYGFEREVRVTERDLPEKYTTLGNPNILPRIVVEQSVLERIQAYFTAPNREQVALVGLTAHVTPDHKVTFLQVYEFQPVTEMRANAVAVTLGTEPIASYYDQVKVRNPNAFVTWIHSHPNLESVGPSPLDYWIMKSFFKGKHLPALIVDPVDGMISASYWDGKQARSYGGVLFGGEAYSQFANDYNFSTQTIYDPANAPGFLSTEKETVEPQGKLRIKISPEKLHIKVNSKEKIKIRVKLEQETEEIANEFLSSLDITATVSKLVSKFQETEIFRLIKMLIDKVSSQKQ